MDQKLLDAIEQLKCGEESGFNYIYSVTCQSVYRQASNYFKNKSDAEDVVQAVYIAVYQSIGTLNDPNAFYGWLKMIVRNQACSVVRRFKDDVSLEEGMEEYQGVVWEETTDTSVMPETVAEQKAISEMVANIIEELPDPYKSVITMSLYENMTQEEIAKALDCPVNTVKTWNRKAKEIMKGKVEAIEKKDGVRLHALSIPTILLAFNILLEREPMEKKDAGTMLTKIKTALMVDSAAAVSCTLDATEVVATSSTNVATKGIWSKIAGLGIKAKIMAIVGVLVVGGTVAVVVPKVLDTTGEKQVDVGTLVTPGVVQTFGENVIVTEAPEQAPNKEENIPETTPEVTPEITPEITPEVTPEITPEITPVITPEITPTPVVLSQEQITLENIRYSINDDEVTILGLTEESQIEELVIPAQIEGYPVTEIAIDAFLGNENIKRVEIKGAKIINDSAFRGCTGLVEIVFPEGLGMIGDSAFLDCRALTEIILPNGLKQIDAYAFFNCTSVKKVVMPDSVESIGTLAFFYCTALKEINISKSLKELPESMLNECSALERIIIPSNIETIGIDCFICCYSLKEVIIEDGVKTIGTGAFMHCSSLEEITLPDSVTKLGNKAFLWCLNLKTVRLSENLQVIDEDVFGKTESLYELVIPESVTRIEECAFLESAIESIHLHGKITYISDFAFPDYMPNMTVEKGSYAESWAIEHGYISTSE